MTTKLDCYVVNLDTPITAFAGSYLDEATNLIADAIIQVICEACDKANLSPAWSKEKASGELDTLLFDFMQKHFKVNGDAGQSYSITGSITLYFNADRVLHSVTVEDLWIMWYRGNGRAANRYGKLQLVIAPDTYKDPLDVTAVVRVAKKHGIHRNYFGSTNPYAMVADSGEDLVPFAKHYTLVERNACAEICENLIQQVESGAPLTLGTLRDLVLRIRNR